MATSSACCAAATSTKRGSVPYFHRAHERRWEGNRRGLRKAVGDEKREKKGGCEKKQANVKEAENALCGLLSYGSAQSPLSVMPMTPRWAGLNESRYTLTADACARMTLCATLLFQPCQQRTSSAAQTEATHIQGSVAELPSGERVRSLERPGAKTPRP
jgi:hypothetical protein